ncbi:MAG TPA: carbohydrate ABC transporter permease [Acidothermaceae bacterium]|jgi:cellobiose transport system permease protein
MTAASGNGADLGLPMVVAPTRSARGSRPHKALGLASAGRLTYLVLGIVTFASVFPLYWTIVMASHTNHEMGKSPPAFLPSRSIFHNFTLATKQAALLKSIVNTVIVAGTITIGTVLFCTLAGFAFAKLRFRGQGLLFAIVIGTLAVPTQLGIIPLFIAMAKLHWVNHLQAVIFPTLVSAFGVFFMRQYLVNAMPTELLEAGWVDGASTLRIFRSVVLPIARPAMAVLGMLTFLAAWNDFFWPIVALTSRNPTVQVALASMQSSYVPQTSIIMAGTILGTLPILVVFLFLGRQIVSGIMQGAVKG